MFGSKTLAKLDELQASLNAIVTELLYFIKRDKAMAASLDALKAAFAKYKADATAKIGALTADNIRISQEKSDLQAQLATAEPAADVDAVTKDITDADAAL